ncbi:hypothetical protein AB4407_13490 [Vibrio sp. 10N.261.46.E11]|uniref:hypothetical protein n=1 Tax=Vibrio sp. 10N.261.46.E11 TaxID=3229662 RepID=UPI003552FCEF
MNIPNFPTDSLYKFISISGVFLLVSFLLAPEYSKYKIDLHQLAIEAEKAQVTLMVDFNTEDITRVADAVADAEKEQKKLTGKYLKLHEETRKVNRKNRLLLAKLEGKLRLSNYYTSQFERVESFQFYGILASLIYTVIGFVLWYSKVQRPMDLELNRGGNPEE